MRRKDQFCDEEGINRSVRRKRPAEEPDLQDAMQESGTSSKRHNAGTRNFSSNKESRSGTAPSSETLASAYDMFSSPTPDLAPANPAPIKARADKAILERLDGVLVKGGRTCTSSCKYRGETHELEVVICRDPNCKTIRYHKVCLRKEVRDFCGRYSESTWSKVLMTTCPLF